jgi:tetratricopeptide (TPR) repeat protein
MKSIRAHTWMFLLTWCVVLGGGPLAAADKPAPAVPLQKDLGDLHHPITTTSKQAQRYFDQGLRLAYAFNHNEAHQSFQEAARLDPQCAMCYWGMALVLGPNINMPMDAAAEAPAHEAAQKAVALSGKASRAEQLYIRSLAARYAGPGGDRAVLDKAYADAMREVARQFPDDPDALALFAEAMMDLRPWDYWTKDGAPQPGTSELVSTLEVAIKKAPNHPGACHLYIHAVEAVQPQLAVPCAERLAKLMPGAGHLVHMPAHIYMRVGRYDDAVKSNVHAVSVDHHYIEGRKPEGLYPLTYYPHNVHFLWSAASMGGRSAEAIKAARDLAAIVPDDTIKQIPPLEVFKPTELYALVRFGKWDEILAEPEPAKEFVYTRGVWYYARGLAFVAKGQLNDADYALGEVRMLSVDVPETQMVGLNSASTLLQIASYVLAGELAAHRGRTEDAVAQLRKGVELEDGLTYEEPSGWHAPVRHNLGAVLLAAGMPADAEAVYREDLRRHPENGWSLFGLSQALEAQNKKKDATGVQKQFKRAWKKADVTLRASRF